jgi:UPF0716 protein FxsA
MLGKLLLAFILIPLIEFFLLLWIADKTSILATIALVIVTGIIGSLLARAEGLRALQRFRSTAAAGKLPGAEIRDGLLIAFAAALLLTPGLLTDLFGFALLIPATRRRISAALARRFAGKMQFTYVDSQQVYQSYRNDPRTVEGSVVEPDYADSSEDDEKEARAGLPR